MGIENVSGRLSLLRVHDRGTKFGPPGDRIDVEVVVQFVGKPADAYGLQLRADSNGPAREGMLGLLRDGFNHNWIVNLDYDIKPGRKNAVIIRVWLTKPLGLEPPVFTHTTAPGGAPTPVKTKAKTKPKAAKKTATKRSTRRP